MICKSSRLRGFIESTSLAIVLAAASGGAPLHAMEPSKSSRLTAKAGRYMVELRLPQDGLFAEDETDVEFHVSDSSQDDPVQGPPPIVKARIAARVTMPTMSSMPAQSPKTHAEGVPGDYGVVLYFPHGGEYRLDLSVTPPGDKPFTVTFKLPVADATAARGRASRPKPYTLEVSSNPAKPDAGAPALLTIAVRSRDTRQPVAEFDIVHERQIHIMIVSADMQYFAHVHPNLGSDGRFTLEYTFPTGGEYHIFADAAPKGAGSQILMQPLRVAGPSVAAAVLTTPSLSNSADGIRVSLATDPESLPVGRAVNITFTLRDASASTPTTDLEPYLGAMAHLMLINQDGVTFVHCHPDESDPRNGHAGALTFLSRFPKAGLYRAWLQFQRGGRVSTVTFTFKVRPEKKP